MSNTPWSVENSFGNSYSNIFGGMKGIQLANIYCRHGLPHNNIVNRHFQITERSLLRNLINRKYPSGKELLCPNETDCLSKVEQRLFDRVRKSRLQIYFWARNLVWATGRWKSAELIKFISDFNPDLIFQPVYYSTYLNTMALFIKELTNAPMVGYVSDDVYTLRQFSLSPLYWIDRFIIRSRVKKLIKRCEYLYVISNTQKREYENCFKKECRVLTKGADFSEAPVFVKKYNSCLTIVYTGNIGCGRWRTLSLVAEALKVINTERSVAHLMIYTTTPLTRKMIHKLNVPGCSSLLGGVSAGEVYRIQREADILVHVESFSLAERLAVHQSFSTKIVDYLAAGRCIMAIGSKDSASIDYLRENDAAIIACSKRDIYNKLETLVSNTEIIDTYARKAWDCGKKNHQISYIQNKLYDELAVLVKEKS